MVETAPANFYAGNFARHAPVKKRSPADWQTPEQFLFVQKSFEFTVGLKTRLILLRDCRQLRVARGGFGR